MLKASIVGYKERVYKCTDERGREFLIVTGDEECNMNKTPVGYSLSGDKLTKTGKRDHRGKGFCLSQTKPEYVRDWKEE